MRLLAEMSTAVDINVVSRVAIWPKNGPSLDEPALEVIDFELDSLKTCIAGRPRVEFGTVRPRVQIPGPRPDFELTLPLVSGVNVTTRLYWCSTSANETT